MKNFPRYATLSAAALLLSLGCQQQNLTLVMQAEREVVPAMEPVSRARITAIAMIESLTDEQRDNVILPFGHQVHDDWHFIPRQRLGISMGEMNDNQRHRLHELLQTGLSDSGYLKTMGIIWAESVLQEIENGNPGRDPGNYNLLLFGNPTSEEEGSDADWGWRFEGHHLSLNFTYTEEGTAVTPMFMGASPAVVPSGLYAGRRVLADEHNLAFAFIELLTDEQREAMMIGDEPGDIVTGPGREESLSEPAGLSITALSSAQRAKLVHLLWVYFNRLDEKDRGHFLDSDSDLIHFAWAGSTNPDEPHYYRIYSEGNFVIEYCTRDGGVNHVHGVFHDLTDPLAHDLLREHFEQHHAGE